MDVVIQPPSTVRPGEALATPLIVSLKNMQVLGAHGPSGRCPVWAFASIIPGGSGEAAESVSDQRGLLSGSLVDSPHEAWLDDSNVFEYVRFPRLTINQVGEYRIQVSLIRMCPSQVGTREFPGTVESVGFVRTKNIRVDSAASTQSPSE